MLNAKYHYAMCLYSECLCPECHYAECHYAECYNVECCGTLPRVHFSFSTFLATLNPGADGIKTLFSVISSCNELEYLAKRTRSPCSDQGSLNEAEGSVHMTSLS